MIFYAAMLVGFIILNTFVIPAYLDSQIEEVDYGTFLTMLDSKEIQKVQVEATYIYFSTGEKTESISRPPLSTIRIWLTGCMLREVNSARLSNSNCHR